MKLSAAQLKLIAIITMLIDHMTEVIIGFGMLRYRVFFPSFLANNYSLVYKLYWTGRYIGRIAYPIFAFFIVEGFVHTKSKWKYALRLFLFALISEIPFDMAFNGGRFELGYQNVYFNLLIGLLVVWAMDEIKKTNIPHLLKEILMVLLVSVGCYIAEIILKCDYGYIGILAIASMYLLKNFSNVIAFGAGVLVLSIFNPLEAYAFVDLIFMKLYDGSRGKQNKYLFYCFYPVHLLILGLILHSVI